MPRVPQATTVPLKSARVSALITQVELARRAGVDASTIVRAEKGQRISQLSEERIARALGLTRDQLFGEAA